MQDLTAFVAQFLLLVGLLGAVIHNVADERHLVERDGARHLGGFREVDGVAAEHELVGALVNGCLGFVHQLLHTRAARARHRLVGAHDEALQAELVGERLEHRHDGHGRAVRVGHNAGRDLVEIVRDSPQPRPAARRRACAICEELSIT